MSQKEPSKDELNKKQMEETDLEELAILVGAIIEGIMFLLSELL